MVRLEPLEPNRHAESLFTSSHGTGGDSHLWDHLAYGPFTDQQEFTAWLKQRSASEDPLFFAVVDIATKRALGMASYLRIVPEHGVIEIGHIWFAPALQRTRQATEAIFLLARNAFDVLGYRRLEWKCDALNEKSRRAAERFGFTYEGIFRQHMVVKDRNRDTAWFSITDGEWPLRRAAFEAWLAPVNFDQSGVQRQSLSALRALLERDGRRSPE
jgi:RimJ/RimL family protein N-acetyltransferase